MSTKEILYNVIKEKGKATLDELHTAGLPHKRTRIKTLRI